MDLCLYLRCHHLYLMLYHCLFYRHLLLHTQVRTHLHARIHTVFVLLQACHTHTRMPACIFTFLHFGDTCIFAVYFFFTLEPFAHTCTPLPHLPAFLFLHRQMGPILRFAGRTRICTAFLGLRTRVLLRHFKLLSLSLLLSEIPTVCTLF